MSAMLEARACEFRDEMQEVTRIALAHHGVPDDADAHETIARAGAVAYVVALRLLAAPALEGVW